MESFPFGPLVVIALVAFTVPIIAARIPFITLPIVVTEILAGIIVGQSGFNLLGDIDANASLSFLVTFGFAYLMFLSGLEVDFSLVTKGGTHKGGRIRGWLAAPTGMGGLHFLMAFALAIGAGWLLTLLGQTQAIFLTALILGPASVGIVMPTLKERGLLDRPLGQTALFAALTADFVTIFLVTFLAASHVGGSAPRFALTALLIVAFLVALRAGAAFSKRAFVRSTLEVLSAATSQLKVRGSLALMIAFLALSQALGAEIILGAFLAGAVISFLSRQEGTALRSSLDAIGYGFFIPIFFIAVGARFELGALLASREALALVPVLLIAAILIGVIPSAVFMTAGVSARHALATGFLLSGRLSLTIAVAEVGLELGLVNSATNSAIILVAIATSLLGPAVFNRLMGAEREEAGGVFLIGEGDVAEQLRQRLRSDRVAIGGAQRSGKVNGAANLVFDHDELRGFETFVAATEDDDFNLQVCLEAKVLNPKLQFVALVRDPSRVTRFHHAGIKVANQAQLLARELDQHIRHPSLFAVLEGEWGDKEVVETIVRNPRATGMPLRRLPLPGDVQVLLVRRDERSFVPRAETVFDRGDWVILAGECAATETAATFFSSLSGQELTAVTSLPTGDQDKAPDATP